MNGSPQEGAKILFKKSADAGMTFSRVMELSGTAPFSFTAPQIIALGSNVYVAWADDTNTFFARSIDAGASFEPVSIGDEPGGDFVRIAAYGNITM
jgi:hypothetical protein